MNSMIVLTGSNNSLITSRFIFHINNGINKYKDSIPEDGKKFLDYLESGGKAADFHKGYYGEESFEEYTVDPDVIDYVSDLELESAYMFGNCIALQEEIESLKLIVEGYKILASGKTPTEN